MSSGPSAENVALADDPYHSGAIFIFANNQGAAIVLNQLLNDFGNRCVRRNGKHTRAFVLQNGLERHSDTSAFRPNETVLIRV